MTRRHFLEMARHGDAQAIATLINRNLHPKGIFAIVKYELGYLQVCLEAEQTPRRSSMLHFIKEGLKRLNVEGVRIVRVYGRRKGRSLFAWHDCFTLTDNPPTLDPDHVSQDSLKKLARQGDYEAIAILVNQTLSHKHWDATVTLKDQCLKINIYGETPPDENIAATLTTRLVAKIRSAFFSRVEIRGYGTSPELLQWLDSFENEETEIREKVTNPHKHSQPTRPKAKATLGNSVTLLGKMTTWF